MDEWEEPSGYAKQSRAENTMFRYKTMFGDKLRSRLFESQTNKAILSCSILNKKTYLDTKKPIFLRYLVHSPQHPDRTT